IPDGLVEYKLFTFNGKTEIVLVCKGIAHTENRTNTFFDREFNLLPIQSLLPNQKEKEEKPAEYEKLLEIADTLSEGMPHVRVDFYIVDGHIYVGEMTFFHNAGFCKINPEEWDKKMGDMIPLDIVKKYN
ncbi:MAG: ATP-grasp fold amidoligase family protein, partial [Clostridia bacterium]|nr:ATP-grasp fold amidoligase family protein [Clostridia bacterium]